MDFKLIGHHCHWFIAKCFILYINFVYQHHLLVCLAIIDQYLATCSNPRWHRFNNIKLARYIIVFIMIIYFLHGIPFLIYYGHVSVLETGKWICTIRNQVFLLYFRTFFLPICATGFPLLIIIFFGFLAYRNIQNIAYRTVPLVRRELDKQMTVIVLIQACCDILLVTPYLVYMIFNLITGMSSDILRFVQIVTTLLYNMHFAVSIQN